MKQNIFPLWAAALLIMTMVFVLGAGAWFLKSQERTVHRQVEENLLSIARSKASRIADWRQERLTDAALMMSRSALIDDVNAFLATAAESQGIELRRRFDALLNLKNYAGIILTTTDGRERLRVGEAVSLQGRGESALATALQEHRPVFDDLSNDGDKTPHITIVAPLFAGAGETGAAIGAIVLVKDAGQYLYPLIQSWPVPSRTAETLLVRRDGDQVVFLNDLRHQPHAALKLRFPLTRTDIPAVMAVLGRQGIVYGTDYRGVSVVSALVPIPDSPWFMIAKVDTAEAYAAWRFQATMLVLLLLALVVISAVLILTLRQRSQKRHYRKLHQAESDLRATLEKQAVTLQAIGDAVIATDADGRVELMNPVAEALTGWMREESLGMPLSSVFRIINEETRRPVEDPVALVLRKNAVIGLANHTLLIARDGRETAIADSGAPIRGEEGEILGVVLVFRDQTEERLAQRLIDTRFALIDYASTHSLDELLTRALDMVGELVASPIGFYHFVEPDQLTLSLQQWSTKTVQEFCRAEGRGMHYPIEQAGVWADCVHQKRPIIHNDYDALAHKKGMPAGHARVVRELVVPVMRRERIMAILGLGNKPTDYSGKDVEIVSYMADLTWEIVRQKQAAEQLRESERLHKTLLGNLPGMAYRCKNDTHWTMELISGGGTALTGYSALDLIGNTQLSYADLIHPEDREMVLDQVQAALHDHRPFELTYRITTAGGEEKWVWEQGLGIFDGQGDLLALEGFIIDITDRRRVEAERERLLLAVEQSAELIVITDAEGTIQYVNEAFEQTTGYSRAEAIGQNPRMLKSGRQDQAFYQDLWTTITAGRTWQGRLVNRRKDGSVYTEEATISPVFTASGTICNFVAAKRDITEHLRLSQQLQQAQKMESIGRLAGGVAHDFNNMLGVISGFTELALERVDPAGELHADLEEVLKAARRSADITRQLLAFARKQTIAPQVLDLNDTVDGMLKMLRRLIGEDIDLVWRPAGDLQQVKLDPAQIDQILVNLFVNARDAIAGVGKVTIETHNVVFDEDYCADHVGFVPGRFVQLAVSDDGSGMDRETLEKIFEPFFTTKELGRGTGLGLATVFGIVKQNNGFMNAYSEPGKGTTFRMHFPSYLDEATEDVQPIPESTMAGDGETVLVVEDEASILRLTTRILTNLNYRVLPAQTPAEALRLAEMHAGKIVLLITDVVMPEMNGRELAEQVQAFCPQIKRLFMSGYTADVIAHRGVLDEGMHFIQKPFSAKDLAVRVRLALV